MKSVLYINSYKPDIQRGSSETAGDLKFTQRNNFNKKGLKRDFEILFYKRFYIFKLIYLLN